MNDPLIHRARPINLRNIVLKGRSRDNRTYPVRFFYIICLKRQTTGTLRYGREISGLNELHSEENVSCLRHNSGYMGIFSWQNSH
jgi:hypothetical protein